MRCLAIAQAWQDAGGDLLFAHAESTPAVDARLRSEGMRSIVFRSTAASPDDAKELIATARSAHADWVIVDGYHFTNSYQLALQESQVPFMYLGDQDTGSHWHAQIVVNPDVRTSEELSATWEPETELLLGPEYALIRREFLTKKPISRSTHAAAGMLLFTMGGSDPDNLTGRLMASLDLSQLPAASMTAIVGGSNPHWGWLQELVQGISFPVNLVRDPDDMSGWMASTDIVVIVAGNTIWESLFMGCVTLCCSRSDSDAKLLRWLAEEGAIIDLGSHADADLPDRLGAQLIALRDEGLRQTVSASAQKLVDGHGATRLVEKIQQHLDRKRLR